MNSFPISFPVLPFPNIAVAFCPNPISIAMLQAIHPLTFITFTIKPGISTNPFWSSIDVATMIYAAIWKFFISLSIFEITLPFSLKYMVIIVYHQSFTMSFCIDNLSIIGCVFISFEFKILRVVKLSQIDYICSGYIVLELV
jgi:hypothetical protein